MNSLKQYGIKTSSTLEGGIENMCNLSKGLIDKGKIEMSVIAVKSIMDCLNTSFEDAAQKANVPDYLLEDVKKLVVDEAN